MQLQKTNSRHYVLLSSGILVVEPNPGLLAARSQLLSAADQYIAASSVVVQVAGLQKTDIRVAILSESLGEPSVRKLAEEIRLYYPDAQILIFGRPSPTLADQLYDESIESHCRPEQLLDVLFRLTRHFNDRLLSSHVHVGPQSLSLSALASLSLHEVPAESDPSKEPTSKLETPPTGRDVPSDETMPHLV